jgi:AcrR family transcriptional regulator
MPRPAGRRAPAPEGRSPGGEAPTRSALLAAAARRYARYGPRKTTMEEVARAAGLSRATVYKHFPGKEGLYRALLEQTTQEFLAELRACLARPGGAREKLREIVVIARQVYSRSPVLLGAAAGDDEMRMETVASDAMRDHEERVIALLTEVLAQGVRAGEIRAVDPRAAAYLMYQLGNVLVVREVSGRRDFPFEEILGAMDDLINHGLAPSSPNPAAGPGS